MFKAGRQPAQSKRFTGSRALLSPQAPSPAKRVRSSASTVGEAPKFTVQEFESAAPNRSLVRIQPFHGR